MASVPCLPLLRNVLAEVTFVRLSPDVVLLLDDLAVGVVAAVGAGRPRPRARRHDGEQQPGKVGGAEIEEETKRNS